MPQGRTLNNNQVHSYQMQTAPNAIQLIGQLRSLKQRFVLNDWGYILLLYKTAQALFPDREPARLLFLWATSNMSRFDVKIFLKGGEKPLRVGFVSKQKLVRVISYNIKGKRYYILPFFDNTNATDKSGEKYRSYTYRKEIERKFNPIDFEIKSAPNLGRATRIHRVGFKFGEREYTVRIHTINHCWII